MKEFFNVMGKYFAPYKGFIAATLGLNLLSALLNVCSFVVLIPILNILFQIEHAHYDYIPFSTAEFGDLKDVTINNLYYGSQQLIATYGPSTTMLILGGGLALMTLLKTSCYFGGSATLIPIKTGVVRDIRNKGLVLKAESAKSLYNPTCIPFMGSRLLASST